MDNGLGVIRTDMQAQAKAFNDKVAAVSTAFNGQADAVKAMQNSLQTQSTGVEAVRADVQAGIKAFEGNLRTQADAYKASLGDLQRGSVARAKALHDNFECFKPELERCLNDFESAVATALRDLKGMHIVALRSTLRGLSTLQTGTVAAFDRVQNVLVTQSNKQTEYHKASTDGRQSLLQLQSSSLDEVKALANAVQAWPPCLTLDQVRQARPPCLTIDQVCQARPPCLTLEQVRQAQPSCLTVEQIRQAVPRGPTAAELASAFPQGPSAQDIADAVQQALPITADQIGHAVKQAVPAGLTTDEVVNAAQQGSGMATVDGRLKAMEQVQEEVKEIVRRLPVSVELALRDMVADLTK